MVDHYKVLEAQSGRGENEQLRLGIVSLFSEQEGFKFKYSDLHWLGLS